MKHLSMIWVEAGASENEYFKRIIINNQLYASFPSTENAEFEKF